MAKMIGNHSLGLTEAILLMRFGILKIFKKICKRCIRGFILKNFQVLKPFICSEDS